MMTILKQVCFVFSCGVDFTHDEPLYGWESSAVGRAEQLRDGHQHCCLQSSETCYFHLLQVGARTKAMLISLHDLCLELFTAKTTFKHYYFYLPS